MSVTNRLKTMYIKCSSVRQVKKSIYIPHKFQQLLFRFQIINFVLVLNNQIWVPWHNGFIPDRTKLFVINTSMLLFSGFAGF